MYGGMLVTGRLRGCESVKKTAAERLFRLVMTERKVGEFKVRASRRLRLGFHPWVDEKPLLANLEVTREDGVTRNLLLIDWRQDNVWYLVVYPDDRRRPLAEIHKLARVDDVDTLQWVYSPAKRDGRNAERVRYFTEQFGDPRVQITLPASPDEVASFLEEIFSLVDNRMAADELAPERPQHRDTFPEGREFEHRHLARERSSKLVALAKEHRRRTTGRLACDVCSFDFAKVYGRTGDGYIEAHHLVPVMELTAESETRIEDLALVCANCHRMLHRRRPWLGMSELKELLVGPRSRGSLKTGRFR
jgi:hypothetical protein